MKAIKILRLADIILIAGFLIFASAFYFRVDLKPRDSEMAVIKVNGAVYEEAALNQDKDIEIYFADGTISNIVRIKDGVISMIYAACPDKRCMSQNYFIVCLPNRVTVEIAGKKSSEFDIII